MKIIKLAQDIKSLDIEDTILLITMLPNTKDVEKAVKFIHNISKNFNEYESTRTDNEEN